MICAYHNVTEFFSLLLHLNYSAIIWESLISATLLTVDSSEWKLCFRCLPSSEKINWTPFDIIPLEMA